VTTVRRRRDAACWALALCPGVGVGVIVVNPYGNEGIFRATLFALPWLAILAAQAWRSGGGRWTFASELAILLTLSTTFVVASFGLDATNVLRRPDREAFQLFQATHPDSSEASFLLMLGPGDLPSSPPTQTRVHLAIKRTDIDDVGFALTSGTPTAIEQNLTREFVAYAGPDTPADHLYTIWSPVSSYYGVEYGIHTAAQYAALRDAFAISPSWMITYSSGGTILFEYRGE
jgi:hypothetical protein